MKRMLILTCLTLIFLSLTSAGLKPRSDLSGTVLAQAQTGQIRTVDIVTNDIIYDRFSGKIYASVPSSVGFDGNSITVIDPVTGNIGPSIFVGSEPGKLAISDDGQYLYVSLDGAAAVRRFNIKTLTPELQFPVGSDNFTGPFYVDDLEVRPGDPEVVAISRRNRGFSPRHEGVGLYVNGMVLEKTTSRHTGSNVIDFCNQASMLFGYNNETTDFGFRRMKIDGTGLTILDSSSNLISGFNADFTCDGGLVYSRSGAVLDPNTRTLLGTFTGIQSGALVRPDSAVGRTFFLTQVDFSTNAFRILAYDQERFLPLGYVDIPGVNSIPVTGPASLIRWGNDGLAFRTVGKIYLIQSDLISGAKQEPLASASSASFRTAKLARESIVSTFGEKLATGTETAMSLPLPTQLGGTTVTVRDSGGSERLAPLFFVSPTQINYQIPQGTLTGRATITVTAGDGVKTVGTTQISLTAPGLFSANSNGRGVVSGAALRVIADMQVYEPIIDFDSPQNAFVPRPIDLGPANEQVFLVCFGTGIRFHTKSSIKARIGNVDVPVIFAGAVEGLIGLDQINLLIPRSLSGRGVVDVVLTMDGQTTNVVQIAIQ